MAENYNLSIAIISRKPTILHVHYILHSTKWHGPSRKRAIQRGSLQAVDIGYV